MDARTFGRDIAHIDLTTGGVENRPAPEEWVRKYIGARGLGVRYVLENGADVDALCLPGEADTAPGCAAGAASIPGGIGDILGIDADADGS